MVVFILLLSTISRQLIELLGLDFDANIRLTPSHNFLAFLQFSSKDLEKYNFFDDLNKCLISDFSTEGQGPLFWLYQ